MSLTNFTFNQRLFPSDLVCLVGLQALKDTDGDSSYGDANAISGFTNASGSVPLSTMISDARAFWATGAADVSGTYAGVVRTGLSSATPYERYDGATNNSGVGTGNWMYEVTDVQTSNITANNWAPALWALFQIEGFSSQVADCWNYLMSFTSNATYETSATASERDIALANTGTFDPSIAIATEMTVTGTYAKQNGSSFYEWQTVGTLAGIQSVQAPAKFLAAKKAASAELFINANGTPMDAKRDFINLRCRSGLSYQLGATSPTSRGWFPGIACVVGFMYRYAPKVQGVQEMV